MFNDVVVSSLNLESCCIYYHISYSNHENDRCVPLLKTLSNVYHTVDLLTTWIDFIVTMMLKSFANKFSAAFAAAAAAAATAIFLKARGIHGIEGTELVPIAMITHYTDNDCSVLDTQDFTGYYRTYVWFDWIGSDSIWSDSIQY